MTRPLLVLVLLLELLEAETVNVTMEDLGENGRNQTVTQLTRGNYTMQPQNSSLYNLKELEDKSHSRSPSVSVEDEGFQQEEDHVLPGLCSYSQLRFFSFNICGVDFFETMETMRPQDRCLFERTARSYYDLTECLKRLSHLIGCFFPNPVIQEFFLHVHSFYFSSCSREEEMLEDAPGWVVVFLTLVPVALIPVLVHLLISKSKAVQNETRL